ncbi:hypothetical protein MML48_3g00006210 [Holotrichia oblita]|uniref:Uncharacterized protein n=1 Tax=Holotrichia oblita TaxID=644536 RepID=A0ACB9TE71_HOLOL|nr:hypothetical protein MML48_3g00006210 [Holotrichia oblita]
MPIDIPNKNVFFSYNLEAVYSLPGNETREDYPPLVVRDESGRILHGNEEAGYNQTLKTIDRKLIYNLLETKLTMHGYPGHSCLLRIICETALMSVTESNGVLGDLFHIIFTYLFSREHLQFVA